MHKQFCQSTFSVTGSSSLFFNPLGREARSTLAWRRGKAKSVLPSTRPVKNYCNCKVKQPLPCQSANYIPVLNIHCVHCVAHNIMNNVLFRLGENQGKCLFPGSTAVSLLGIFEWFHRGTNMESWRIDSMEWKRPIHGALAGPWPNQDPLAHHEGPPLNGLLLRVIFCHDTFDVSHHQVQDDTSCASDPLGNGGHCPTTKAGVIKTITAIYVKLDNGLPCNTLIPSRIPST